MDHQYRIGERVEVEIDFLTKPESKTVVSGVGLIVRKDAKIPGGAAVQFLFECGIAPRSVDQDLEEVAAEQKASRDHSVTVRALRGALP